MQSDDIIDMIHVIRGVFSVSSFRDDISSRIPGIVYLPVEHYFKKKIRETGLEIADTVNDAITAKQETT